MLQLTVHNFNEMLGRFSTAELESLLARSPYFQQAHLLLAKKYQLERNPKFDEQLQLAALYTNDRELFYTIFNPVASATVKGQEQAIEFKPIQEEGLTEPIVQAIAEPVVEEIQTATMETAAVVEEGIEQDNVVIEEYLDGPADVEPVIESESSIADQVSFASPHTFDEWLSVFKKGKPAIKAEEPMAKEVRQKPVDNKVEPLVQPAKVEEMDEELDKMITASVSADYLHQLVEDEKHYSRGLDAFIADQIKRKRKNERPNSAPEDEIAPDIITETLAKLYESQKRYEKAVKAYEALSLKFPEKSDLFAARINYLRKLI